MDNVVYIPQERYVLKSSTSEKFQDYIRSERRMLPLVARANMKTIELLRNVEGVDVKNIVIDIVKESPYDTINHLCDSVGRTWFISKEQIEGNLQQTREFFDRMEQDGIKEKFDGYLNDGLMEKTQSLDRVVKDFGEYKDIIREELKSQSDFNSIVLKYLKQAVRKNFSCCEDFSKSFNAKYQFDRLLQGDYYGFFSDVSSFNRRQIIREFNEELAPELISRFGSELFFNVSDN